MLSVAVVIPTYNRPECVQDCLAHLEAQSHRADRVVVVDSSPGRASERVVRSFDSVIYVRNPLGRGHTPESRAIGVSLCSEDVIAFLDDDANAYPTWLEELLSRYADPKVAGVGGRALNGVPGEGSIGVDAVGQLLPNGSFTGNFAADPGRDVDVDHLLGANMSFRRNAIEAVGGIRGGYPGTCIREESDLALRLIRDGHRLVYTPSALVDHLPGVYAKGKRFDRRYTYYDVRNTTVLLNRVYGPSAPIFRSYLGETSSRAAREVRRGLWSVKGRRSVAPKVALRGLAGGLSQAGAVGLGLMVGVPVSFLSRRRDARQLAELSATPSV